MGGDGGTCASNRRYMRGAGTADHTADSKRTSTSELAEAERDRLTQAMTTCAVSGNPIDFRPGESPGVSREDLVACPYGRLYLREAAVEALLRRREQQHPGDEPEIGWQIRGLKDLHPVRFQVTKASGEVADGGGGDKRSVGKIFVPMCPITGLELMGSVPAFLIVRKREKKSKKYSDSTPPAAYGSEIDSQPNVLSERAIREMGILALQEEYGPFDEDDMIRLAPPLAGGIFDTIKEKLDRRRDNEKASKTAKKGEKKRKHSGNRGKLNGANGEKKHHSLATNVVAGKKLKPSGGASAAETARSSVAAAVASNPVLSSLFSNGRKVSEKEKKDNLFTRNG